MAYITIWCRSVTENKSRKTLLNRIAALCLKKLLKRLNETLCLAVGSRVIRSNKRVLDAVCFHNFTEFFRSELCTVVAHELLYNDIPNKHIAKLCDVASVAILGIISTSNHFEWLSTTFYILPINGPAKSMYTLCHGSLW